MLNTILISNTDTIIIPVLIAMLFVKMVQYIVHNLIYAFSILLNIKKFKNSENYYHALVKIAIQKLFESFLEIGMLCLFSFLIQSKEIKATIWLFTILMSITMLFLDIVFHKFLIFKVENKQGSEET